MLRRLALYLALTAVPLSAYCADNREDITGDHLSYEPNGDEVLTGNAQIVDATSLLTADEIRLNQKANTASARGHVLLQRSQHAKHKRRDRRAVRSGPE